MRKPLALAVLLAASCSALSSVALAAPQFSGINQLTFHQEKNNKAFVGNGFLIRHQGKIYAVTVKHALLEAKTPAMTHVTLDGHVKGWRIHPNQSPEKAVVLGKLLNANPDEAIDMQVLSKDWLVFEVVENKSPLAVLSLRNTPITTGETLTAYGCSYANKQQCSQDRYAGTYLSTDGNNLRMAIPDLNLGQLRGLSGSPVLDNNHQVVGIVSNVLPATSGNGFDFAPASLAYLREVLEKLSAQ